ncbi:MAG: TIGR03643 family protein [Cryomorphaceae bacterium]|nr:TIGR03643 family protein [Cryomorphaceae bacterium]MBT3689134.1 TIGR03643 family protein [Cryomorphaceae bacterium]MBT4222216.1 TIGR03643 family protein [Cryomorphaceae bacterium]MBT6735817.1 TIGR03643 family protein [Cryomorphaceae bacterium]
MKNKSLIEIDRIIEMAWEDRTPFEAIFNQFEINEKELISLMRNNLKKSSFKLWRERISGRKTKHSKLRENSIDRFKCNMQRNISNNKISKR